MLVLRPADGEETVTAWKLAIEEHRPVALILSRQNIKNLPALNHSRREEAAQLSKGAYIVVDAAKPAVVMLKEMGKEFDVEKRSELGIQMQQTVLDDNAYVFCSHLKMSMIMQSNVTGLVSHPCDYYELTADLDIN